MSATARHEKGERQFADRKHRQPKKHPVELVQLQCVV